MWLSIFCGLELEFFVGKEGLDWGSGEFSLIEGEFWSYFKLGYTV